MRSMFVCVALSLGSSPVAQSPILTELMAKNASTLADEDGDFTDWLEVHNPGPAAMDVTGWFLTDDAAELHKWAFPATTILAPGEHLIVFASGKNRSVAGQELHTNFKLNGTTGEFLALVQPDGFTIASSFAPQFPPQRTDYSYGVEADTAATLVAEGAACTALVPSNGSLGATWTGSGSFPGWPGGGTGVGYEQSTGYETLINLDVGPQMFGVNGSAYVRIPFTVVDPSAYEHLTLRIKYDDGFRAYLNGQVIASANAPTEPLWNSLATASHPSPEPVLWESFDVTANLGDLVAGANILAIHGLNVSTTSSDFLILPELLAGAGYGSTLVFFEQPSPGSFAGGTTVPGFVSDVAFDVPSGFHSNPFSVTLSTVTAGATIMVTTDGSVPSSTNGTPYTAPIPITETSNLRAAAVLAGLGPSLIETKTYIFVEDVVVQSNSPPGFPTVWGGTAPAADYEMDPEIVEDPLYSTEVRQGLVEIPALSLVLDMNDLFGPTGMYSNPQSSGRAWERPVAAELVHPDGTPGFEIECGLRIQGGRSRDPIYSPKHSFSLRFRDAYGKGSLEHEVFPGSPVDKFEKLHIRHQWGQSFLHWAGVPCSACGPNNVWGGGRTRGSLLREVWGKDVTRAMGSPDAGRSLQVNMFLNGVYWGVYAIHERQDAYHYAQWHGGDEDDYDAMKAGSIVHGTIASWNRMRSIAQTGSWAEIQSAIAIDNYIDYTLFNRDAGNTDISSGNNWRAAGGGPNNAPWRFYHWDIDHILEAVNVANPSPSEDPAGILNSLMQEPEFVVRFGDRVHKHLYNDGALTPSKGAALWNQLASEVDTAIVAESARWGDYRRDVHPFQSGPYELYTKYDHVVPHRTWLNDTYFPVRNATSTVQFRVRGLYPVIDAPAFSQHGGTVLPGFQLTMSTPPGTVYYTTDGTDPRLEGGAVSPTATVYAGPITINAITRVKSRVLDGPLWSALNEAVFVVDGIMVNEVMARNTNGITDEAGETEDWIELYNEGSSPVSASGMYLTDDPNRPTKWVIPPGHTINPGETLLIWADEEPQGPLHASFKLAAAGEQAQLYWNDGETLLSQIQFGPQLADVSTGWLEDGGGALEMLVTYPVPTPDNPNEIQVCGDRPYSAADPTLQPLSMSIIGSPAIGQSVTFGMVGSNPNTPHALFVAAGPAALSLQPISNSLLLINQLALLGNPVAGVIGGATFVLPIPNAPVLIGASLFAQDFSVLGTALVGSNGLELKICP